MQPQEYEGQMASRARARKTKKRSGAQRLPLILIGAGVLVLVAALMVAFTGGEEPSTGTVIPMLDDQPVDLADYEGQTVLVNFWASWCPPCRAEMPELQAYYQAHQADGFVLIAVNSGEQAATARNFIQQTGYTFPVGLDIDGSLSDRFGVPGLPTSIVINPEGEITYRHTGAITRDVLDAQVTPLLAAR